MAKPKPTARRATLEDLKSKPMRTKEVELTLGDETVTLSLRAINTVRWDTMVGDYPPSEEDKKEGAVYDIDGFGPALIAACTVNPAVTEEDAKALWNDENWSRGELLDWFTACASLCNQGLRVPFTGSDSEKTQPSPSS